MEDPRGPVSFVLDDGNGLAPKTLRHFVAALRQWAVWREDVQLQKRLGKPLARRLPQAVTIKPKSFLPKNLWHELIRHVELHHQTVLGACISFMARRGSRVGDVVRMSRKLVVQALKQTSFQLPTKKRRFLQVDTDEVRWSLEIFVPEDGWDRVEDLVSPGSDPGRRRKAAVTNVENGLRRIAGEIGIADIHPHLLRRTVAAHFLDEVDGDMNKLMDYMGWTSLEVAREYVAMRDHSGLQKAARSMLKGV